jgi:hypothetical protein
LAVLRQVKMPVWLQDGAEMVLAHPAEPVAQVVLNNGPPQTKAIAEEAQAWTAIHSKF